MERQGQLSPRADEENGNVAPLSGPPLEPDDLPFAVLLYDLPRAAIERVLAKAASATLARAIFVAAQSEHLGRKIALVRAGQVISESE